ncbi:MAG TPA: hypothetical protein VFO27_07985 [Bryobacteraceae bacterium]|nr:hypothetical protein [Bryobacteraceae bacterium]
MNEVNTLDPERRIFRRPTFNPNDGVFVSIHPDSAPGEIFVLALGLNREDERRATPDVLPTNQLKRVILRCNAGLLAKTRTRGLGFGFEQSRENVLPCTTSAIRIKHVESLRPILQAGHAYQHFGMLMMPPVIQYIAPKRRVTVERCLPFAVMCNHSGNYFVGSLKCRRRIASAHNDRQSWNK